MSKHIYSQDRHSQVDRLLAQQCLVRRFRLDHAEEFFTLVELRDELADVLRDCGLGITPPHFDSQIAPEIAAWFSVVEGRAGRNAIRNGDEARLADLLGRQHMNLLRNATIEAATACLLPHLSFIENLLNRFNYGEHVGLLAMTALCSGETLAFEQARVSNMPHHEFLPQQADRQRRNRVEPPLPDEIEFRLVSSKYRNTMAYELNLDCAIHVSAEPQRFSAPSILIYDSLENQTSGGEVKRSLNLRIELNRAPAEIDDALLYLKSALQDLLIEEHNWLAGVPDYSAYATTEFAKRAQRLAMIVPKRHSVRTTMLGLWCWDLTVLEKNTIAASVEQISDKCAGWIGFPIPEYKDMSTHYRRIRNLITVPSKARHGKIDEAMSRRRDIRLGLRQNEKLPPEDKVPPEDWPET